VINGNGWQDTAAGKTAVACLWLDCGLKDVTARDLQSRHKQFFKGRPRRATAQWAMDRYLE